VEVRRYATTEAMAEAAAADAAAAVASAIAARGTANLMLATGNSQLAFLDAFTAEPGVDWERVTGFHMDEYVGVGPDHPAGFGRYMRERFVVVVHPGAFHFIDGLGDADAECRRYAALLAAHPLDLCCMGIGENGHLAFNDPPFADFDDPVDVKAVALEEASRRQQVGEGHFASVDDVPTHAITVTIPALLRAGVALVVAPEARKAEPVRAALTGPVTTACPASVLQRYDNARVYLDAASSSLLD
jgi:glucosamine-6-phosphate deaminase